MWLINWIKKFGAKQGIREIDTLKPFVAGKIREAQKALGNVSPDEFADVLLDEVKLKMCGYFGVDPKEVGLDK